MSIVTSNLFGQLKSNNIKTINGKKYFLHKVEKKQTLYSISKLYSVDLEAIYNLNPELKSGVKAEQEIIIPIADKKLNNIKSENVNLSPEAIDTIKFITHKAGKSETLYSICKKFNIKEEEIIELNPLLKIGLKEGQLLILGKKNKTSGDNKNSLVLNTSKINIIDSFTINKIIKTKKKDYKIALVLPFKLNETINIDVENLAKSNTNFPLSSELAVDFYLGFKKAIKYLVTDEFKISIYNDGNFKIKNIKPNTLNKIPALNIDLPYFIHQSNPIHSILLLKNYKDDVDMLEKEIRFQKNTITGRMSFLKALQDKINFNTSNSKFNNFINSAINKVKDASKDKIPPPTFWEKLIETQGKLSELPETLLNQIIEEFNQQDYEAVEELIDEVKNMKWVENPEENKTESFTRKTLHNFINEQNKVRFKTSETLYERLLTCLEKMRSN